MILLMRDEKKEPCHKTIKKLYDNQKKCWHFIWLCYNKDAEKISERLIQDRCDFGLRASGGKKPVSIWKGRRFQCTVKINRVRSLPAAGFAHSLTEREKDGRPFQSMRSEESGDSFHEELKFVIRQGFHSGRYLKSERISAWNGISPVAWRLQKLIFKAIVIGLQTSKTNRFTVINRDDRAQGGGQSHIW